MNQQLNSLQPYPFEKLRLLFDGMTPPTGLRPINLGIGEPKHPTPELIKTAMCDHLGGLASYPSTIGSDDLRRAIATWLEHRYAIQQPDPATQVLPVNGSREALFAFAQSTIDASGSVRPVVMCPNPFYQIYEGAALLAGAEPYFVNADPARNFAPDYASVPEHIWQRVQLLFVCSPGNPTGAVLNLDDWRQLFALSDRYGFVIASDECYSEIYFGTDAPLGGMEAAQRLGRTDYARLVSFSSLSKRSNVPGMRSGFVAGDAVLLKQFLTYRTYHGCAMSPTVQAASAVAWRDEQHVIDNRRLYASKFATVTPMLQQVMQVQLPDAGFYLWADVSGCAGPGHKMSDTEFAQRLYADFNVTVLPGSYLARDNVEGINPGRGRIRMALVASVEECTEAAQRIIALVQQLRAG